MKRAVMIMLLVAGALALVYFLTWVSSILSLVVPFTMPPATRRGGVGSATIQFGTLQPLVLTVVLFASSLLLWRACANLAAKGDGAMGWHGRFHGWAAIVGPLLILSVAGLGALLFAMFPSDRITGSEDLAFPILILAVFALVVASFGLNLMQLYSVVVAFRRRGRA